MDNYDYIRCNCFNNKNISNNTYENNCLKIGDRAPDFEAMSTYGKVRLSDCSGKWVIFFSHPGDFTPVGYL